MSGNDKFLSAPSGRKTIAFVDEWLADKSTVNVADWQLSDSDVDLAVA